MSYDDLIIAFFPCIYFCAMSQIAFNWNNINYRGLTYKQRTDEILKRMEQREYFFAKAVKMLTVAKDRGLRLIMENPWGEQTYLKANFVAPPTIVDKNRRLRGDYFVKPTAYWFINCEPTNGFTPYTNPIKKIMQQSKSSPQAGLCSEERSLMAPEYACNFIHDFILGKSKTMSQLNLFE